MLEVSNLDHVMDLFDELEEIKDIQNVHVHYRFMEMVLDKEDVPIERLGIASISYGEIRKGLETLAHYQTVDGLDGAEVFDTMNGPIEFFGYWFDDAIMDEDGEEVIGMEEGATRCNEFHPLHEREYASYLIRSMMRLRSQKNKKSTRFF